MLKATTEKYAVDRMHTHCTVAYVQLYISYKFNALRFYVLGVNI